jgi:hypothetical protein
VCSVLLTQYEQEGETFSKCIITGYESYVHFFTPESKRASSEWRHQSSSRPKKVRSQASAGKVLLTIFWDHKGVILENYLEQTVKGTVICFRISLSQQFKQNAVACCLLACVCSMTSYNLSYRVTDSGFKIGGVTPSAIFTRFGTERFSPLLAPKRCSTWMSLQIG